MAISRKFDLKPMDIRFDSVEASNESAKGNNSARFVGWRQPRSESGYVFGGTT
jgi:hypothetical protein